MIASLIMLITQYFARPHCVCEPPAFERVFAAILRSMADFVPRGWNGHLSGEVYAAILAAVKAHGWARTSALILQLIRAIDRDPKKQIDRSLAELLSDYCLVIASTIAES